MSVLQLKSLPHIPLAELEDWGPVPEPIDSEPSQLRGITLAENEDGSSVGLWACSPGKWRRQVKEAEMAYFIEGHCTYTDETGIVTEIIAGDMLYFPAMSLGIWEIKENVRKAFICYKTS